MLDKPALSDARLTTCLREAYGLVTVKLTFLALGADADTAVYKAVTSAGQPHFVKLRRGLFDEMSVKLPRYLSDHGVSHLIPVVEARTSELWVDLEPFTVTVYPFVTGKSGYEVPLTARNWHDFGVALKRLHTLDVPPELHNRLRRETYDAAAREQLKAFLSRLEDTDTDPIDTDPIDADPIAGRLAAFMREKQLQVVDLVSRAERCAKTLRARAPEFVVCHADLHAGNLLISGSSFYIIDWDDPILAPKERDLMFIGGGQGFAGYTPQEEEELFYEGYGSADIDTSVLAYYRFERIVQDLSIYCDDLERGVGSEAERRQSLRYLMANFRPGGTVERAYAVATG